MTFNEETKLGELLDNPATKAILLQYIPQIGDAKFKMMLGMARGMSLKTVVSFPQANLTSDKLQEMLSEFAAL